MASEAAWDMPHPRLRLDLLGHAAAERELSTAAMSGRLPHAWLIGGGEGIGKATLAYRFARFLLADENERLGADTLAVRPDGRTARQVGAKSHPNLMVLERVETGEKAAPKTIPVDQVRRILSFFGTTAADGGHRVCIVDAVEDLNAHGLNALLKTVEEPPAQAVILLLSHAPHRLLPTIRSRCRKLMLSPLAAGDVERIIAPAVPDADARTRAANLAEGSVTRALALTTPRRLLLTEAITAALRELPTVPMAHVLAIADAMADKGGENFDLGIDRVFAWATARIEGEGLLGAPRLAPLAHACERIQADALTLEAYNLDRRAFVIGLFETLAEAWRQGGLPARV